MRDACHQRVDVAVVFLQSLDVTVDPVLGQALAALCQMREQRPQERRVLLGHGLAEVRNLTDLPQQFHPRRRVQPGQELRVLGQRLQGELVVLLAHALQHRVGRRLVERGDQRRHRPEVERRVAPFEVGQWLETVILDRFDGLLVQTIDVDRRAEGAIVHVAAGAARDLRQLDRTQLPRHAAVVFAQRGEPDMVDVHVEAHADRVGRDQIVDLARLEHLDLCVARARAERAHHDCRAAAMAANQFGDRVDLVGREADHGRARRKTRGLLRADIGKLGEARPGHDVDIGQELVQHRADRVGAQQHGLVRAARIQDAVAEEVPALRIGRHLHLVDGKEGDRPVERHGFDGANEVARALRDDLFFAGDQRDPARALQLHDAVVVLACQQAQRKADHARLVAEHAFDRQIGLAGICGAEDGRQAAGLVGERHCLNLACAGARRKASEWRGIGVSRLYAARACCSRSWLHGRRAGPAQPCPGPAGNGRGRRSSSRRNRPISRRFRDGARR